MKLPTIKELDRVVLTAELPDYGLKPGDMDTVARYPGRFSRSGLVAKMLVGTKDLVGTKTWWGLSPGRRGICPTTAVSPSTGTKK